MYVYVYVCVYVSVCVSVLAHAVKVKHTLQYVIPAHQSSVPSVADPLQRP